MKMGKAIRQRELNPNLNSLFQETTQQNRFARITLLSPSSKASITSVAQGQLKLAAIKFKPIFFTSGLAPCIAVALFDKTTGYAALGHFDSDGKLGSPCTSEYLATQLANIPIDKFSNSNTQVLLCMGSSNDTQFLEQIQLSLKATIGEDIKIRELLKDKLKSTTSNEVYFTADNNKATLYLGGLKQDTKSLITSGRITTENAITI